MGRFITIDGGDGCGKSTQIERLRRAFATKNLDAVFCREPGSTQLGERVRDVVLNFDRGQIDSTAEMLLFMAARAQLVREVIAPAIRSGRTVVCDRFLLSTLVYQGFAGGHPLDEILAVGRIATGGLYPDITFVLDIDPQEAFARLNRPLDRMEAKGLEYHRKVRDGFRSGAKLLNDAFGGKTQILDATRSADDLAAQIHGVIFGGEDFS